MTLILTADWAKLHYNTAFSSLTKHILEHSPRTQTLALLPALPALSVKYSLKYSCGERRKRGPLTARGDKHLSDLCGLSRSENVAVVVEVIICVPTTVGPCGVAIRYAPMRLIVHRDITGKTVGKDRGARYES